MSVSGNMCRLCLRSDPDGVDIFQSRNCENSTYSDQLVEMFRIELEMIDNWSPIACGGCVEKLEEMKEFKCSILAAQDAFSTLHSVAVKPEPVFEIEEVVLCEEVMTIAKEEPEESNEREQQNPGGANAFEDEGSVLVEGQKKRFRRDVNKGLVDPLSEPISSNHTEGHIKELESPGNLQSHTRNQIKEKQKVRLKLNHSY